jgi:hypothetical protein
MYIISQRKENTNKVGYHYYQSGVQFSNLNRYGTLKMK